MKVILFYLITTILLLMLKRISYLTFTHTVSVFVYIAMIIGFIGGNYYSIFMNGTLLMDILPDVSFKQNEVIRWSSILVCLYLGFLIPKRTVK